MARQYQPQVPFNVPFRVIKAVPETINGVRTFTYVEYDEVYYCNARAYISSVKNINDLSTEEDTLTVDSYWLPFLKRNDRIRLLDDDSVWELTLEPENINRRNQWSRFKVVRIRG